MGCGLRWEGEGVGSRTHGVCGRVVGLRVGGKGTMRHRNDVTALGGVVQRRYDGLLAILLRLAQHASLIRSRKPWACKLANCYAGTAPRNPAPNHDVHDAP